MTLWRYVFGLAARYRGALKARDVPMEMPFHDGNQRTTLRIVRRHVPTRREALRKALRWG